MGGRSRPRLEVSTLAEKRRRVVDVAARGRAVLASRSINRSTAFTHEERAALGLTGLLPRAVSTMEDQLQRVHAQYEAQPTHLSKYVYLQLLRDRNEVLFFRLLTDNLEEMLPIVYTPTVGEAIQRFSHEYRRARGVYLSIDAPDEMEISLRNYGLDAEQVDLVVVTDSEGILGIGDWGVGGIEIAIGKLAVYTTAGGVDPTRVIPVVLDVGTDNQTLLDEELYVGSRQPRVRGERYDDLIERFVETVTRLFPHALLHWEDLGADNARRLLLKYADRCCTFNDDMQGTAAVVLAAALSAARASGTQLRDHTVVVYGAGTAGIGIADALRQAMQTQGLSEQEALGRFYALGRRGLLTEDQAGRMRDFQVPYARSTEEVAAWSRDDDGCIRLDSVVRNGRPTMLIGTSTDPGAFTEDIVRTMAASVDRPVIMALSNPTSMSEALPQDLLDWTEGRALVATGSPFEPVLVGEQSYTIAQANNALVFPGLGLGVIVSRASRVTDGMLLAAATTVAQRSDGDAPGAPLLPGIDAVQGLSRAVAVAVAETAIAEGVAQADLDDVGAAVDATWWYPDYPDIRPI